MKSQSLGQEEEHPCESVAWQAVWEPQHGEEGLHTEWCEAPGVGVRMVWSASTKRESPLWPFWAWEELEKCLCGKKHNERATEPKMVRKVSLRESSLAELFRVWMSKENIQNWGQSCVRCQSTGRTKTGAQRRKASSGRGRSGLECWNPNGDHEDVCMGEGTSGWVLEPQWVTMGTGKGRGVVRFRRMDQINEHIKDNGSRFLTVWKENHQKEENYYLGTGGESMNAWF